MNKELIKEYADTEYPIVGDYNTHRYGNDRMNEYVQSTLADVVRLSNGVLCGFEKPSIKKDFCFHDEGAEYEFYKDLHSSEDRMKTYFFNENLKGYDELISVFKHEDERKRPCVYLWWREKGNLSKATWEWWHDKQENEVDITESDEKLILDTLVAIREGFVKRLNTWWKKYGVEHLNTWTYWADR